MDEKKIIIFICFIVTLGNWISAQSYQIKGRIILTNDSVSIANIKLYNLDNELISGKTPTLNGNFSFDNVKEGGYILTTSSMGYIDDTLFIEKLIKNLDVGFIYLSPTSLKLDEVVVKAKNIVNKDGIKYVYPTQNQLKNSTDAMLLLEKMNLPRLDVDANMKTVKTREGDVIFCINGRDVSGREIAILRPEDIVRIEYHDIPEARYNYAPVVLNFITKQIIAGGNIYLSLWQGLLTSFGEDNIVAKINNKNSEFSVNYYLSYRDWDKLSRTNDETFELPNKTIHRFEDGIPAKFAYQNHSLQLNYNYQNNGKIFNTSFTANVNHQPHRDWNSKLYSTEDLAPTNMTDFSNDKKTTPSIKFYYQQPIDSNQTLIFNISGAYSEDNYKRYYKEDKQQMNLSNLTSIVDDKQYAYQMSALYEYKLKKGIFSTGVNHKQSFTTDYYSITYNQNVDNDTLKLRFSKVYIYTQWGAQIKKLYYRIGLGIDLSQSESDGKEYNYYTLKPSLSLIYYMRDYFDMSYYGSVNDVPPSLSALSNYSQRIDSLQIQKGNPKLKRWISYHNALSFNLNKDNWGLRLYFNHTYHHKPIMESTYIENHNVIRTMENHKNMQTYIVEFGGNISPFKDFIQLNTYIGMKHFASRGNNYHHHYNNYYYGGKLSLYYNEFSLSWFTQQNTYNSFDGETLTKNEDGHMLTFAYNTNKYRIAVDVANLFATKHINAKENYSKIAPYTRYEYLKEIRNLIRINFVYNFSFGKKYKVEQKKINGEISSDSGILKGEK